MNKKYLFFSLLIFSFFSESCFRRFIKSDKQIEKHYAQKKIKPDYIFLESAGHKIHFAYIHPNDSLPLLVLIHGAPGAWYGWMNLLDDSVLQNNFRIIAFDRLGYGKSEKGKALTSIFRQAEVMKNIIQKYKYNKKTILIGRSFGSPIAASIAASDSLLIDGMLLVSSAVSPQLEKFFWFSPLGKRKLFRYILPVVMNMATDEKYTHINELKKLLPEWKKIKIPVTVLQGKKDFILSYKNAAFLDSVLVSSPHSVYVYDSLDHFITYKKPELVKEKILNLYNQIVK